MENGCYWLVKDRDGEYDCIHPELSGNIECDHCIYGYYSTANYISVYDAGKIIKLLEDKIENLELEGERK